MGVTDPRTGEIRARADWSIILPVRRVLFYCAACLSALEEAASKPIPGLDPPPGASDFWRPSLVTMVRLADMEIRRRERAQQQQKIAAMSEQPILRRERGLSPQQWAQVLVHRRLMREMRARDGEHLTK